MKESWNYVCLYLIYCLWQGSGPSSQVSMIQPRLGSRYNSQAKTLRV